MNFMSMILCFVLLVATLVLYTHYKKRLNIYSITISILFAVIFMVVVILNKKTIEKFHENKKVCDMLYLKNKNKKYTVIKKMISESLCKSIIQESEDYAKIHGWTTTRHDNYPTTDNKITNHWNTYNYISNYVHRHVFTEIERLYNVNSYELGINELFVAKYQNKKSKQYKLDEHVDGSEFSFVIALNDSFEGGGTYFPELDKVIKLKTGDCLVFSGQNKHAGVKTVSGTRYILTGFIHFKSDDYCDEYN